MHVNLNYLSACYRQQALAGKFIGTDIYSFALFHPQFKKKPSSLFVSDVQRKKPLQCLYKETGFVVWT
ncbi:hypothetical protein QQP08_004452 [Theobroma cacao]|nr:hypothetical protein QQP08_004452 [Theobroma cacao]